MKLLNFVVGPIRRWWNRRKIAKKLHTELYRLIRDRPKSHGHPPPFYDETANDLERAIEENLFTTHELEYLAERLAKYCRANRDGKPAKTVTIDKSFLEWTRIAQAEKMRAFDVAEIEQRLRRDLEETYSKRIFDHPVDENAD